MRFARHPIVLQPSDVAWALGSVGTSGLAIVTGRISSYTGHRLWLLVAVPVWSAAIGIYVLTTWLTCGAPLLNDAGVLRLRRVLVGRRG